MNNEIKEMISTELKNTDRSAAKVHMAVGDAVMRAYKPQWGAAREKHLSGRRACYFSMEFLVGRAVYNNLLCLGITDEVKSALEEAGTTLESMEEIEDAALGNGGLGRLAACFLDSAASLDLPLDGYGIRYKYGLFKQSIVDGYQVEAPDDWTRDGDPWSVRCDEDTQIINFAGQSVKAVPYDMPVFGCKTENVGTLRLWQAEAVNAFDFETFNSQNFLEASKETVFAEDISRVLYPNDTTDEGKRLRLKQQYFFCAASIADIIKKHIARFGSLDSLADHVTIQLNDTHPVVSIPELCRQLVEEQGYSFEKAFEMCCKIFNYTNHTIMAEALEKWRVDLFEGLLPDVFKYVVMISEKFISDMYSKGVDKAQINRMKIIQNGMIHMAFMAIYVGAHTNGVARIHTEILKNTALNDWYKVYPERFQNKTNGITQRRWLALCDPELSALLTELLGSDEWIKDLDRLKDLEKYADDEAVLDRFIAIKAEKKSQLARYIAEKEGVDIDPSSVFDIQIKRLHEYKRQLLNAFSILWIYFGLKDGSIKDITPVTFIFGAKSAPGYRRAKAIIKFIGEIADLVNNDEDTKSKLKVIFVSNYNVSYAEKLVAASDISEQISTAGTEASGTGNMKLMLNGSVTLGTYDGANVEIAEEAGEENNYIFGARVEDLEKIMPDYDPRKIFAENPRVARVVNTLVNGMFSDGGKINSDANGEGTFRELYYSLLDGASWHSPDNYYILGDLEDYVNTKLRALDDYRERRTFARKQWINICNAGKFSSDRTIADYAENIWFIK